MIDQADRSARGNRDDAFERLYWDHHKVVLAYCARRASRADAWDAASEVFLIAWRKLEEVPPGDAARFWLLAVARRVLQNLRRGTERRRRLLARLAQRSTQHEVGADEYVLRGQADQAVFEALSGLGEIDQEILRLQLWEELEPQEAAAVLGISRESVDQRFHRAKKRLGKRLDEQKTTNRATPNQSTRRNPI